MNTINDTRFSLELQIDGSSRELQIRQHSATNLRYKGTTMDEHGGSFEFALMRTTVGRWIAAGESLPQWIEHNAPLIAKAAEAHLKDTMRQTDN